MADLEARLLDVVSELHIAFGAAVDDDYTHDEALTATQCNRSPSCGPVPHRKSRRCCVRVTSSVCR